MRARLLPAFYLALLAFVVGCVFALPADAQDDKVRTIPFEGPQVFAHVLFHEKIEPMASLEEAAKDPKNSLIILFGNPSPLRKLPETLKGLGGFRLKGGNLFIATDQQVDLFDVGVGITAMQVSQFTDPYRGTPECPLLKYSTPTRQGAENPAAHPLCWSLQRGIATNCPSLIHHTPLPVPRESLQLHSLLAFSKPVDAQTQVPISGDADYMVASPKETQRGRCLIVAGHGMFMNGMMLQPDNDNYAFAENAVRWLTEGQDGKNSRRALFIYDGRIIADFNMNLSPPPPPIPMPTVQMLNRLIRGLEEERFFHRLLKDLLGDRLRVVVSALLAALTFGMLLYGAKKLSAGRSHVETAVPSMVGAAPGLTSPAAHEQRRQALLRKDDFWAESRQLTLDWFRAAFDVTPDRWRDGVPANFRAEGSFLARWRLQQKADFVLRLARAAGPMRVSRHQFFTLVETLKELSRAAKDRRLALLVAGKNVRQT